MKWFPLPAAAIAMLAFGLAAYGDSVELRPAVRSVLKTPARQASLRRGEPTIVEANRFEEDGRDGNGEFPPSPALIPDNRPTGSGLIGAGRRLLGGVFAPAESGAEYPASEANSTSIHSEAAHRRGANLEEPTQHPEPAGAGFVGDCCEKPCGKCDHLWDGYCDQQKGCASCGDAGCQKCRNRGCCRAPKAYRQDLLTHLQNRRAQNSACDCAENACAGDCQAHHHPVASPIPVPPDGTPPAEGASPSDMPPVPVPPAEAAAPSGERAAWRTLFHRKSSTPAKIGR